MAILIAVLLGASAAAIADDLAVDGLGFDEIIFVKRKPYSSDHYYTDINNGTSKDRFLAENGIYIYNLRTRRERPVVTTANMPGGKGFIGKISLSFDARKVIFDFRRNPNSGFRIWEVHIDGTGLRQVLLPPKNEAAKVARWGKPWHTDDIHPCYLQDGKIMFSSTRSEHTVLCGGSAALVAPTLHRMDADGSNIEQLTKSPVSEFCPVVLDDGRVMYHRWEYIDKGARVCKTIWSMNPDGTMPQELYGVNDDTTTVYMYPQAMPGDLHRIVCVGTCHFPQGGCLGAIMLIDLQQGALTRGPDPDEFDYVQWDSRFAVTNVTPKVFIERRTEPGWFFLGKNGKYVYDKEGKSGHLYTHPYPVDENRFLVSYKEDPSDHYKNVADAYSLYLIDTEGNHTLIHRDKRLSLWHPTPLVARKVPPRIHCAPEPQYAANNE
ncbi:MAG: TolB family protein, partial [Planctomycetota bacterium]